MKKNVIRQSRILGGKNRPYRIKVSACMVLSVILVMLMAAPAAAQADAAPLQVVKINVEKVLSVLRDPAMQDEAAVDKKKAAIRSISNDMFNWPLLSRGVLLKNWNKFTDDQKNEFVSLFKVILEDLYINRILAYKDETIEYVSSQMLSDDKAEVKTLIISSGAPVDLTYRLGLVSGKWGIYDVKAEGVSMMELQRKQYREFFSEEKTPAQLLAYLREKVGEE